MSEPSKQTAPSSGPADPAGAPAAEKQDRRRSRRAGTTVSSDGIGGLGEPRADAFLSVRDLRVHFPTDDGVVKSVDGLSFDVARGKTLGIVGESGSGKSVTSMSIMGLHKPGTVKMTGSIRLGGEELIDAGSEKVRSLRGKRMAMIFQDPLSAMHPFYTVGHQIIEAYKVHHRSATRWLASTRSTCSTGSASRSRTPASTTTPTSSRVACASGR